MRKSLFLLILILSVGVFFYLFSSKYGLVVGGVKLAFDDDKLALQEMAINFLEDIQFKDFDKAASYHSEGDRKKVDIPKLIERIFQVKPEFLDIMKYEIMDISIDRSGDRAKIKTHTTIKMLNTKKIKEPEIIFYWHKSNDGKWYMELESSLK